MSSASTHPPSDTHGNGNPSHLAHHFDTPAQQIESGKLGMWVFLATEILMFGGLFCAYSVYRHNHPDVFAWAHTALAWEWGTINTVVLLASSLTMAWGVRAAQMGNTPLLKRMLLLTILGGFGFMGIKFVEYKAKWEHNLWAGQKSNIYSPKNFDTKGHPGVTKGIITPGGVHPDHPADGHNGTSHPPATSATTTASTKPAAHAADHNHAAVAKPAAATQPLVFDPNQGTPDAAVNIPKYSAPSGLASTHLHEHPAKLTYTDLKPLDQQRVFTFYQIYFCMTGLHGIHVLVGMGLIYWIYRRAARGEFTPAYNAPVDLVGLYWHLVDLIWIFLFPLLYLIH